MCLTVAGRHWPARLARLGGCRRYLTEVRSDLADAYAAAGQTSPAHTDPVPTPQSSIVFATHIAEPRIAVIGAW